jgi:tetratricopeptide (TPR) repeat protein
MALISSGHYSPFSLTELQSGLGSLELRNGDRRRSRRLLQASLTQPNDNVLAQTEWALSVDRLFEFDPQSFDVERNYEAFALEAFHREQWEKVLEHCESWFMDMPFSRRPLMMGAHVATVVLDDYAAAQTFCQAGLIAHPNDPALLNNFAYALALDGKADEAIKALDEVPLGAVEDAGMRACLIATRGLALFRKGQIEQGRALYQEAIENAARVPEVSYRQLAALNYVREELLAQQVVPDATMATIREAKVNPKSRTVQILKDKVLALHDRSSTLRKDAAIEVKSS